MPVDDVSAAPPHLVRFDRADWPDPGPPPSTWPAREEMPWELFATRLEWVRARRRWIGEQGDPIAARSALAGR